MPSEAPRTWTLDGAGADSLLVITEGPEMQTPQTVYEAGPVDAERERMLDVLERVENWLQIPDYQRHSDLATARQVMADVKSLLAERDRLPKGEQSNG